MTRSYSMIGALTAAAVVAALNGAMPRKTLEEFAYPAEPDEPPACAEPESRQVRRAKARAARKQSSP